MHLSKSLARLMLVPLLATGALGRAHAQEKATTVKGYVLDSACAFIKNLKKPVSAECALACARAGSPLVILSDDGTIYWPISDSIPAIGENQRLMKFAGQRVIAKGKLFERGGSHALVIKEIAPAPAGK